MHRTKAQSRILVHSKVTTKTETSGIGKIAHNSFIQHRKQTWPREANTAKSVEISPVFKKKTGNQSKSIKMLQLPVPSEILSQSHCRLHKIIVSSILNLNYFCKLDVIIYDLYFTYPVIPKFFFTILIC